MEEWRVWVLGLILGVSGIVHLVQWLWFMDVRASLFEEHKVSADLRNQLTVLTLKRELAESKARPSLRLYGNAVRNTIASLGSER